VVFSFSDDVLLQKQDSNLCPVQRNQSGVFPATHCQHCLHRRLQKSVRLVHAQLSDYLRRLAFICVLQVDYLWNNFVPQRVEEIFYAGIDEQVFVVGFVVILKVVLVVQLKKAPFASVSQQIGADECLDEAEEVVEVIGRVDVVERSDHNVEESLHAGANEHVLRLRVRQQQVGEREGHRLEGGLHLQERVRGGELFDCVVIVAVN